MAERVEAPGFHFPLTMHVDASRQMLLDGELWYCTDEARDLIIRLKSKCLRQPARSVSCEGGGEQRGAVATEREDILRYPGDGSGLREQTKLTGFCRTSEYGKTKK